MLKMTTLIKISLSDTEKKVIVIVLLVTLIILLLIGIITKAVKRRFISQGKRIDTYLTGYVKYGFVKNESEFKAIAKKKNSLLFFKAAWIPIVLFSACFAILGIFTAVKELDYFYVLNIYYDGLIKFKPNKVKFIGMNLTLPKVVPNSIVFHNTIEGYFAYFILVLVLCATILIIDAVFKKIAREHRIKQKSKELFSESLDKVKQI